MPAIRSRGNRAAVGDAELGEAGPEAATREGAAIVGAECYLARGGDFLADERDRLVRAAAQLETPSDDLAGVAIDPDLPLKL